MTSIDNMRGIGLGMCQKEGKRGHLNSSMEMRDSKIYGESPAPDCPQNGAGGYCFKQPKCGIWSASSIIKNKEIYPTAASKKPYSKYKSHANWGGVVSFENVEFINFPAKTKEGAK
jgi:hypothetical protein